MQAEDTSSSSVGMQRQEGEKEGPASIRASNGNQVKILSCPSSVSEVITLKLWYLHVCLKSTKNNIGLIFSYLFPVLLQVHFSSMSFQPQLPCPLDSLHCYSGNSILQ